MKILYVDCYSVQDLDADPVPSSMSIGYGVTCSDALCEGLARLGHTIVRPLLKTRTPHGSRTTWLAEAYPVIERAVRTERPDIVFFFHSFGVFPAEIRRLMNEMSVRIPFIGYSHGSHWDPTDGERSRRQPGMEIQDLANLQALDRVLFASQRAKSTVVEGIGRIIAPAIAAGVAERARVVGLPIYNQLIDNCYEPEGARTIIVFNHAPVAAKCPAAFMSVAGEVLIAHPDVDVLFTRRFDADSPGAAELAGLVETFGARIILGGDLSITDYYRALWSSSIQVSTAIHEGFGVATVEAMYTHNCCLLPNRESYPEIVDGAEGVLYETLDDLTAMLHELVQRPDLVRQRADDLATKAQKHLAAEVCARVGAVIDEVCADERTRSLYRE